MKMRQLVSSRMCACGMVTDDFNIIALEPIRMAVRTNLNVATPDILEKKLNQAKFCRSSTTCNRDVNVPELRVGFGRLESTSDAYKARTCNCAEKTKGSKSKTNLLNLLHWKERNFGSCS